jgi:enoyl-CoA hydratase/carnithine racemase
VPERRRVARARRRGADAELDEEAGAQQSVIEREQRDGIVVLRLVKDKNLVDSEFLGALNAELDSVEADADATGLVVTGNDKYFSNGFDLEFLGRLDSEQLPIFIGDAQRLVARVLTFPMPTVAALNGHAFGIAAMFALAHDQRVMRADRGWWCLPEIDLGLPFAPFMLALIRSRLSDLTASEAILSGRRYAGAEAVAAGIAHASASEDALIDAAVVAAASRAGKAREITATLKRDLYAPVLDALH